MTQGAGPTERLFVAAELGDTERAQLAPRATELARELDGRAVAPANLHLTLVFLGSTPSADVAAIHDALHHACRSLPTIHARQLGISGAPGHRTSRIVAAAFEDAGEQFARTATTIADVLAQRWTIAPVPLPFWPHVTLVRLHSAGPVRTISAQSEQMFAFDRVTLYASRSAPSGPAHYVPLARIALTANDRPH